ncbi:hypothetical protein WMY93_016093 [Mugilogobius chulae]|uniref:Uncharacterized protein n=1 Tax=Mugilogobius chulae TaxID=88201 RepID=A0AAW0NWU9_9GOBI
MTCSVHCENVSFEENCGSFSAAAFRHCGDQQGEAPVTTGHIYARTLTTVEQGSARYGEVSVIRAATLTTTSVGEAERGKEPAPRPALPPWERQSPVKSGSPDPRCDASVEKAEPEERLPDPRCDASVGEAEPGKERLPRPALRCLFPVRAARGTETRFGSPGRDEARNNTVARTLSGSMRSIMIRTRSH